MRTDANFVQLLQKAKVLPIKIVKMVKKNKKEKKILFQCEECKLFYENKKLAEKCDAYCKEHHACNIELIANSVRGE